LSSYDIGRIELLSYFRAYHQLPKIKLRKQAAIESLYEECVPGGVYINTALGEIRPVSINVEELAITIIERKEAYDNLLERCERKVQVLEEALATLLEQERSAIQSHYLRITNQYYQPQTLKRAESRLCAAISEKQKQYILEKRREQVEAIL
jgi:hypothetical protein